MEQRYAIIGGKHVLSKEQWAVSIVRKNNSNNHAFIIIEGIEHDDKQVCIKAELVQKSKFNNSNAKDSKADVILKPLTDLDDAIGRLKKESKVLHAYTWTISKSKKELLIKAIEEETDLKGDKRIDYIKPGKNQVNTFFNKSLDNESKASIKNNSKNQSAEAFFGEGHNCMSWAIEKLAKINLPAPVHFEPFIAAIPSFMIKGQNNGDEIANSKKDCLVM